MTSITAQAPAPAVGIEQEIPNWLVFDWPPETQHRIYRDWATYYFKRRRASIALHYYNMAMELDASDYKTLYRRSQTLRKAADIEAALSDAVTASELANQFVGPNSQIDLQVCDATYELNMFENAKLELHKCGRKFIGVKAKFFGKRLISVDSVIKDVTGKAMSAFYLKNQKVVHEAKELMNAKAIKDNRPRWKILKDQNKCDVLSIPDVEEVILSPLEIARRKRGFNVLHQTYVNNCWNDVLFMKNLTKNPSLLLPQCKRSNAFLQTLSSKQYEIVRQFMKMLQSRSPMYFVNITKFPNHKMHQKNKEAYLYRIQLQTHRNMIQDLRQIRKLRKEKNIKGLSNYVEKIMGDYYVMKTNRIMCWKFQFINEVYNTLALGLAEQYSVPKNKVRIPHAMTTLLLLRTDKVKDVSPFVFGDRSTHQSTEYADPAALKARKLIARLENRIRHSTYSIELCYLYHQIADVHFQQGRYDECRFVARKAIQECRNCNSAIWKFLSIIILIKSNVVQHKIEGTADALQLAVPIVSRLQSPMLTKFLKTCIACNEDAYSRKLTLRSTYRNSSRTSLCSAFSSGVSSAHSVVNDECSIKSIKS